MSQLILKKPKENIMIQKVSKWDLDYLNYILVTMCQNKNVNWKQLHFAPSIVTWALKLLRSILQTRNLINLLLD